MFLNNCIVYSLDSVLDNYFQKFYNLLGKNDFNYLLDNESRKIMVSYRRTLGCKIHLAEFTLHRTCYWTIVTLIKGLELNRVSTSHVDLMTGQDRVILEMKIFCLERDKLLVENTNMALHISSDHDMNSFFFDQFISLLSLNKISFKVGRNFIIHLLGRPLTLERGIWYPNGISHIDLITNSVLVKNIINTIPIFLE